MDIRSILQLVTAAGLAAVAWAWPSLIHHYEPVIPVGNSALESVEEAVSGQYLLNSLGMKLCRIATGRFAMGSESGDSDEQPVHYVTISRDFYIGIHEVTQAQYAEVMGYNPGYFVDTDKPVDNVSWFDATEFCQRLSRLSGATYRLPTEAEWEYSCKAGSTSRYYWGDSVNDEFFWHLGNSAKHTHQVGTRKPNDWGLYDMCGNVWEWCLDWYGQDYYSHSPENDPQGPASGKGRVLRGGAWVNHGNIFRSTTRIMYNPRGKVFSAGFRVVRETSQ